VRSPERHAARIMRKKLKPGRGVLGARHAGYRRLTASGKRRGWPGRASAHDGIGGWPALLGPLGELQSSGRSRLAREFRISRVVLYPAGAKP
jgi:hypothetical protein